jgi:hypothetical protein
VRELVRELVTDTASYDRMNGKSQFLVTKWSKNKNPKYKKLSIWCHSLTIQEFIPKKRIQNLLFCALNDQFYVRAHVGQNLPVLLPRKYLYLQAYHDITLLQMRRF